MSKLVLGGCARHSRVKIKIRMNRSGDCLFLVRFRFQRRTLLRVLSDLRRERVDRGCLTKFVNLILYFLILMLHSNRSVVYGRHFHFWNSSAAGREARRRIPVMPCEN